MRFKSWKDSLYTVKNKLGFSFASLDGKKLTTLWQLMITYLYNDLLEWLTISCFVKHLMLSDVFKCWSLKFLNLIIKLHSSFVKPRWLIPNNNQTPRSLSWIAQLSDWAYWNYLRNWNNQFFIRQNIIREATHTYFFFCTPFEHEPRSSTMKVKLIVSLSKRLNNSSESLV